MQPPVVIGVSGGIVARPARVSAGQCADTRARVLRRRNYRFTRDGPRQGSPRGAGGQATAVGVEVNALSSRACTSEIPCSRASARTDSRSSARVTNASGDISG